MKLHIKHRHQAEQQVAHLTDYASVHHPPQEPQQAHLSKLHLYQQQQADSGVESIYLNMIDSMDHSAATAEPSADTAATVETATPMTSREQQRRRATDSRAAIQSRLQQQQQHQVLQEEHHHQDHPQPRQRRHHDIGRQHRESGRHQS